MSLSEQQNERLKRLERLANDLVINGYDFRYDRHEMMEVMTLAGQFGPMELRRRDLVLWFNKFEKYRRISKKEEAWRMITNSLNALSTAASS